MSLREPVRWGLWNVSENRLDGRREHLVYENLLPVLFLTRAAARAFAQEKYGYIAKRPDLKAEPYGWRVPTPVRVQVVRFSPQAHSDLSTDAEGKANG